MQENNTVDWFGESARNNGNGNGNGWGNTGGGPGNHNGGGYGNDPDPVPVDGGIAYLMGMALFIIIVLDTLGMFKKEIQER